MARFEIEEHFFTGDIYEVSKDDWSKSRRFTDRVEAKTYYEMLEREEVQDSIARNQATTVEQNKEIIANQQRLIEEQQRNNQMQKRPPFPHQSRPVVDPEYQEWLQFKKETDPAYLAWKKEKEGKKAKERAVVETQLSQSKKGLHQTLGAAFEKGACSVKTNKGITWEIIKSRYYTFTNISVIQDIIDIIDSEEKFQIFWSQYKSYSDIIIKSASLRFANRTIITELLGKYWLYEDAVNLIKKNVGSEDPSCVEYIDYYMSLGKKRLH